MEAVAKMGPADFGYIIAAAALVMITQVLWGWREPIVRWAHHYVTQWRSTVTPATATAPVAATATEDAQPVAMRRNEGNEELPRNGGNVVLRAQAELIARLVRADSLHVPDGKGGYKKAGQVALIRLATGLEPNGRPDSDYGRLRGELEPLINPQITIAAGRPEERAIPKV